MNIVHLPQGGLFGAPAFGVCLRVALCLAAIALLLPATSARAAVSLGSLPDPAFAATWSASDAAVAAGQVQRSWLWGPQPFAVQTESYAQSPNGLRSVVYFDKGRMEITDPNANRNSQWFVTSGLLTVELVSGRMKVGDNDDSQIVPRAPARVNVAGDAGGGAPTYADFAGHATLHGSDNRAPNRTGQTITDSVAAGGAFGQDGRYGGYGVTAATYEPTLGHNIPAPLWNWMNRLSAGWLNVLGYPISDAYWMHISVGGQPKDVLIQLFQRRAVTFTPANSPDWQVEYGNIGQHYYVWRYSDDSPNLQNIENITAQLIQSERAANPGISGPFRTQAAAATLFTPVDAGATVVARLRSQANAQAGNLNHNPPDGNSSNHLLAVLHIVNSINGEILVAIDSCAAYLVNGSTYTCQSTKSDDQAAHEMVQLWLQSPSHAAIIHDPRFDQFSVAIAKGSDGRYFGAGIFVGH